MSEMTQEIYVWNDIKICHYWYKYNVFQCMKIASIAYFSKFSQEQDFFGRWARYLDEHPPTLHLDKCLKAPSKTSFVSPPMADFSFLLEHYIHQSFVKGMKDYKCEGLSEENCAVNVRKNQGNTNIKLLILEERISNPNIHTVYTFQWTI